MNKSDMKEIKEALKNDLPKIENDLCRLEGLIALTKIAIRVDDREEFERLMNIMLQIVDYLQYVIVSPEE